MTPQESMIEAAKAGDTAKVGELLSQEPGLATSRNEAGESAVLAALYRGHSAIVQTLIAMGAKLNVFEAAAVGETEQVRSEVTADPSLVNSFSPDGFNLLGLAGFFSHPDIVDVLLERGADVNVAAKNAMRVTAVHAAVSSRQTAVVAKLLARGADPNARQQGGWTPLHGATGNGQEEMVRLLLKNGADAALRNDAGQTQADLAATQGHPGIAALLT